MEERTVLVVEDDEMNMKLVRALLKIGKYRILEASDAESGIALARRHGPDIILMDIQLPGMDGLSAAKIIKGDEELKQIPVIALTALAMQGDNERARAAGCDGYLTKPIDTRTFLGTLASFVK